MATRTAPMPQAPRLARWRINAILLLCVVFALANGHKLFQVQIQQHDDLTSRAASEYRQSRQLLPHRGVIRDSEGGV